MPDIFFIESGKKRRGEKAKCETCGNEFLRRIKSQGKKKKRYCSPDCGHRANRKGIKVDCFVCKKEIIRKPSRIKSSKSGLHFCSRKCKEFAQSLKGNCKQIQPSHYGTSEGRELYRHWIDSTTNACCAGCGENKRYLLSIHHKDGDRTNNCKENFEIVCGNCHMKRHLRNDNGEWKFSTSFLTPRCMLDVL